MKLLHKLFPLGHVLISLLFIGCGVALITILVPPCPPALHGRGPSCILH
jgi:hypothetical protein